MKSIEKELFVPNVPQVDEHPLGLSLPDQWIAWVPGSTVLKWRVIGARGVSLPLNWLAWVLGSTMLD